MRTLSANLTTAQESQSRTPFVTIKIRPLNGDNVENFATTDAINKILEVKQAEGRFGGELRVPGSGEAISAIIKLRDADGTLGSTDRIGDRVDIGWGLNTASGDETSIGEPLFVFRQKWVAREGDLQVELYCFSLWDKLRHRHVSVVSPTVVSRVEYEANRDIKHILMELLAGFFPSNVQMDDGGVFTNETANAADDDTPCVLLSASPQVGDAIYFGDPDPYTVLSLDVDVPGTAQNVIWEFFNGSIYTALSNVVDNTNHFTTSGINVVSFDHPGTAWVSDTINGTLARHIRARVTLNGSSGSNTSAALVLTGLDYGLTLDSAIGATNLEFEPEFSADYQVDNVQLVKELLELTTVGVILKTDGFHLKFVDRTKSVVDYTYDSDHLVYHDVFEVSNMIPNQWVFTNLDLNIENQSRFTGSASDSLAIVDWGVYTAVIVDDSVKSDADGTTLAERLRDRAAFNLTNGLAVAPMNVGQEIWDVVQINDQWTGVNNKGIVTHIVREYGPGVYQIELTMGGYVGIADRASEEVLNAQEIAANIETVRQNAISEALTSQQKQLANLVDSQINEVSKTLATINQQRGDEAFQIQLDALQILRDQARSGEISTETATIIDTAISIQVLNRIAQEQGIVGGQVPTILEVLLRLTGALTNLPLAPFPSDITPEELGE